MIKPPALKIRSTGADEAGKHKTWFATLKRAGYSSDFYFQKSKYLKATQSLLKLLSCTLGVGFALLVVSRLFIYFVKMLGISAGTNKCVVKHVNSRAPLKIYVRPPGGAPPRLRTTELNHLLTMFTQKFYEAIKGFQFYFAREIVYGEKSSKSL